MKKLLFLFICFIFSSSFSLAEEKTYVHPIDQQEIVCKENAKNLTEWSQCTYNSSRAWNKEVDKYYSLLHKKLTGEAKTNLFESQKYWNMYKNNEIKVLYALYNKDYETPERLMYRANQKRNIIKNRAESLKLYYIQTFPDDEKEKIQNIKEYNPDNFIMRGLRFIGF
jgi:uncharacterized protein YecT (DUF1311 family)